MRKSLFQDTKYQMASLDDFKLPGGMPEGVTPVKEEKNVIGEKPDSTVESIIDEAFGEKGYFSNMLREVLKDDKPQVSVKDNNTESPKEEGLKVPDLGLGNLLPKIDFGKTLNETVKSLGASLMGPFNNIAKSLSPKAKFQEATQKVKEKLPIGLQSILPGKKGAAKGDQPNGKVTAKPGDLKGLPKACSLGFLLIHEDLEDLKEGSGDKKKKGKGLDLGKILGGIGGIVMAVAALVAFAVALKLFENIDFGKAIAGVTFFIVFIGIAGALSVLASKFAKSFQDFAKASLSLSLALAVFSLSLLLVSFVMQTINIQYTIYGLAMFLGFLLAAVVIARVIKTSASALTALFAGSILLAVGLGAFALSILLVNLIVQNVSLKNVLIGIGLFVAFLAIAVGLGAAVSAAAPMFLAFAAGAILLSVGLMLFSLAILILDKVVKSIDIPSMMLGILGLIVVVVEIALLGAAITLASIPLALAIPGIALLTVNSIMLMTSMAALSLTLKLAENMKPEKGIKVLEDLIPSIIEIVGQFSGIKFLFKMATATPGILATALAMTSLLSIIVAAKGISEAATNMPLSKEMFDPILNIVSNLSVVANQLGVKGAEALLIMSEAITPIVEAMNALPELIRKFANLDLDQKQMDEAVAKMNNLAGRFIEDVFNVVAAKIKGASKKARETIAVLPEFVTAIDSMIDVVKKVENLTEAEINSAVLKATSLGTGVHNIANTIYEMRGNWKMDDINATLPQVKDAIDLSIQIADASKKFSGGNMAAIYFLQGIVPTFELYTKDVVDRSKNLKNAMENLNSGMSSINADILTKAVLVDASLTVMDKPRKLEWADKLKSIKDAVNPIKSVNKALGDLQKTFSKIAKDSDWLDKMAIAMAGQTSGEIGVNNNNIGARPTPAAAVNNAGQKILDLLTEWNDTGVKILPFEEKIEEAPDQGVQVHPQYS